MPDHRSSNQKRSGQRHSMSNRELADRVTFALDIFCEAIADLQKQQEELAARIAFAHPTEGDIRREVAEFIQNSLAA